ncbi:hypothetical protein Bca52824_027659 [Brassica carinata]|uniref:DUF1221 domain-containing protein n=1 Tax=Brassica carinata TaxID=52824 RepID=A0A8X7VAW9_BRACI|nr:hypothetical protein Bca52824_027659 [Brassica carinata]
MLFAVRDLQLSFHHLCDEIRENLKLEEKHTKWKALEQPLGELHRVFKGELYVKHCMDNSGWCGKVINLHQTKESKTALSFIHNIFYYFRSSKPSRLLERSQVSTLLRWRCCCCDGERPPCSEAEADLKLDLI